jgi:lauroyl/myristoyl acyltransferase
MNNKAELIKSLSESMANEKMHLVVLRHVGLPAVAEMVSDVLRQNDVRAVVRSGTDAFAPLFAATERGATVLVDARDLERAREIYDAFFGEHAAQLADELYDKSNSST